MKKPEVMLHSFEVILPRYHLAQSELVEWTLAAHLEAKCDQKLVRGLKHFCLTDRQIKQRFFECPDVNLEWEKHQLYRLMPNTPLGLSILEKNHFFSQRALEIFGDFYSKGKSIPQHLIHVTCTGYVSPSAPQVHFSDSLQAPEITHAYHMGCYASLPAVRMAKAFVHDEAKNVDLVHTEMCSLHLNPGAHTPEQMVVQTLFADGHIKYRASLEYSGKSFKVKKIKEKLISHSQDDMTWIPSPLGMHMTLSRQVPHKIADALPSFLKEMCEESGLSLEKIQKEALFAVHPGGPKIIEAVQKKLELHDEQVAASMKVLYERGNMSSATLPHVWKEILDTSSSSQLVVSLAFGPGLTIFGGIFEIGLA